MLNKKITTTVEDGSSKLYALSDIKGRIAKNSLDEMKIDSLFDTKYTNFSNYSLTTSVSDVINTPYIAAFGSFTKMFLFTGVAYKSKQEIIVDSIWEYYNDGFNFVDKKYNFEIFGISIEINVPSQFLGNWHSSIFKANIEVGKFPIPLKGQHYLQNKDFNSFREKTGVGKDFRITGMRLHKDKFISTIKLYEDGVVYK